MTVRASCHCGAVELTAPQLPPTVTQCNCSICRRLGAQWAYFQRKEVVIHCAPGATHAYVWGDRCLEFHHCLVCGVLTHTESTEKTAESRVAINANCFPEQLVAGVRVRRFDGADTWKYLDSDD